MATSDDRRSETRERIITPVLYTLDQKMLLQNSYDISSHGMSVMCPYQPDIGSDVRVRFTHPQQGMYMRADGTVVHVCQNGGGPNNGPMRIGIRFKNVSRPALSEMFQ